jgi:hypothetical protein
MFKLELQQIDQQVQRDEKVRDVRGTEGRLIIADWKEHKKSGKFVIGSSSASSNL